MFQFKQFSVDQSGCAMKINTDGVLLGALAGAGDPANILDIGTGTGVIALMLAQRFPSADIDAVEIDVTAAQTAARNFENSPFANRLNAFPLAVSDFFNTYPERKYNLIVSNPPFHLNALESPKAKTSLAKHTGTEFFDELIKGVAAHIATDGLCWLILPRQAAGLVKAIALQNVLFLQKNISIHSFEDSEPHREVLIFGMQAKELINDRFVIYAQPKVYSEMYKNLLKDFFTIF